MTTSELTQAIKLLAGTSAADTIGIAPGEAFTEEEFGDLGRAFGPVRSVVVLAQHITDPVLTVSFRSADTFANSAVTASFSDSLLRNVCWTVVERLRVAGYRAAIVRNARYGDDGPTHAISYKKVAVLAGLGALGKNNLLIHPEWGPWILLRAVVTDAPLPSDTPLDFSPCQDCDRCLHVCPSDGLTEEGYVRAQCETRRGPGGPGTANRIVSPRGMVFCDACRRACPIGTAPPRWESVE